MKKAVLFIVMLLAITSFVSCSDDTDEEIRTVYQVDPTEDGTIKGEDPDDDGEG